MTAIFSYIFIGTVYGIAACFCGKKHIRTVIASAVFCFSITICMGVCGAADMWIPIGIIISGLLAAAAVIFEKAGLFLYGGITGAMTSLIVLSAFSVATDHGRWIFTALLTAVGATAALVWGRASAVIATAINGSAVLSIVICFAVFNASKLQLFIYKDGFFATAENLHVYINKTFTTQNAAIILSLTSVIAAVGLLAQLKWSARNKAKRQGA